MKQIILPKRIIQNKNIIGVENLKTKKPNIVVLRRDQNWLDSIAVVKAPASITIDFGKEMNGGIRVLTCGVDTFTTKVHIRFGESLSEVNSTIGEKNATNNHSIRDLNAELSMFANAYFGDTGFRYVRIDFLEETTVYLQSIVCENYILKKKAIYNYTGEDKRIKDIFKVAKRTIDLCTTDDCVWDGIKRDRLIWIGDIHPEMLALTTLYGKMYQVENSLEFIKMHTPFGIWMNGIPTYSMWWVITVIDYYNRTDNAEFAKLQLNYINQLLMQFDGVVLDDGTLNFPWYFVDWPTHELKDAVSGVYYICKWMVNLVKEFFSKFNYNCNLVDKLIKKLNKTVVDDSDKKQIIALKYFAYGSISEKDYLKLIDGNSKGISTFMSYYILKAIASVNVGKAIEIAKEYFGAMIDLGSTTLWEDFDLSWADGSSRIDKMPKKGQKSAHGDFGAHCYEGFRCSLCHGWATGVIAFIKEYCK